MKEKRFQEVYSQGSIDVMRIIWDTHTGVQYLQNSRGYAGGMTVLVDKDGKPLLRRIGAVEE